MYPSLLDFLEHIFQECDFIMQAKQGRHKEELYTDGIFSRAMVRSLEIIGEATKKLPIEFTSQHAEISWREMARSRDILIHHYFGVDYDIVWNTITHDIPKLHHQLQELIRIEREKEK